MGQLYLAVLRITAGGVQHQREREINLTRIWLPRTLQSFRRLHQFEASFAQSSSPSHTFQSTTESSALALRLQRNCRVARSRCCWV